MGISKRVASLNPPQLKSGFERRADLAAFGPLRQSETKLPTRGTRTFSASPRSRGRPAKVDDNACFQFFSRLDDLIDVIGVHAHVHAHDGDDELTVEAPPADPRVPLGPRRRRHGRAWPLRGVALLGAM